jgi:glutamate/tyrosine decarboxylase-like PLP-dependent enzyme
MEKHSFKAWFLGPKGENADLVEKLIVDAFRDHVFWRRNFHPEDRSLISERDKRDPDFEDSIAYFKQELFQLLAKLKRSVPFFSPRYLAHMTSDLAFPAIVSYFAAMLYNPNNVALEGSPVTTELEIEVGCQLARMMGYPEEGGGGAGIWGHITSGGTVANFEALWAARNLKYLPFAVRQAALALKLKEPVLVNHPARGGLSLPLDDLSEWELLNLPPTEILDLRGRLIEAYLKTYWGTPAANAQTRKRGDTETRRGRSLDSLFSALAEVEERAPEAMEVTAGKEVSVEEIKEKHPEAALLAAQAVDAEVDHHLLSTRGYVGFFRDFIRGRGFRLKPGVIILPRTAHYSFKKLAGMLGFGRGQIRTVALDSRFRMDMKALRKTLQECLRNKEPVVAVVAVCGTTEEGSIDPIHEIVAMREEFAAKGLSFYLHVDAAYGGYYPCMLRDAAGCFKDCDPDYLPTGGWPSQELYHSLRAISQSDSATVDPHKLGFAPYPAGAVAFRDKRTRDIISCYAPYLGELVEGTPFIGQYILEGSKPGAAAAAVWLTHKIIPLNETGYGAILSETIRNTRAMYQKMLAFDQEMKDFVIQPLTEPDTNLLCFLVNLRGNRSLNTMNEVNQLVYQALAYGAGAGPLALYNFIVSHTAFSYEEYAGVVEDILVEMGVEPSYFAASEEVYPHQGKEEEEDKLKHRRSDQIVVLRLTLMSPWLSIAPEGVDYYIDGFFAELKRVLDELKPRLLREMLLEGV